jgi:hypothetical protein
MNTYKVLRPVLRVSRILVQQPEVNVNLELPGLDTGRQQFYIRTNAPPFRCANGARAIKRTCHRLNPGHRKLGAKAMSSKTGIRLANVKHNNSCDLGSSQ